MNISKISAKHPVSVIMLFTALAVTGIISFLKLEISMFPEISLPAAYIVTKCKSLSAEDIEKMITDHIENSISSVSGIKEISSVSREGLSTVKISFGWNEDMNSVSGEIREKIDTVYSVLPFEAEKPLLLLSDMAESTLITLAVVPASGMSISDISRIAETDLKSRLLSIEGVSEVRISGLAEDEIKIDVDYPSLINTSLPLEAVTSAVSSSVFSRPAGKVYKGDREFRIRAETDIKNISDIGEIPLSGKDGLKISDIAEIYTGEKDSTTYFHSNGRNCIGIEIIRTGSSGLLNTADRIKDELKRIKKVFRNDFYVSIIADSSLELKDSLKSLIYAVLTGTASSIIVLILFFKNLRTVLTVTASLPVSLSMVFIFMYFSKISLNLISITGLLIGTGMVFDNTIVVVDRLISEKPDDAQGAGKTVSKTASAVTGSTVTTILIFLPLVFISGISGKLFKDLAFTVIAFVSASAAAAVSLPPSLYMLMNLKDSDTSQTSLPVIKLKSLYSRYLSRSKVRIFYLLLVFTAPLLLIFFIEREIVPPGYNKNVIVFTEYIPGFSSDYYSAKSLLIEKSLIDYGIAEKVHVKGGVNKNSPEDMKSGMSDINTAVFTVKGYSIFNGNSRNYEGYIENLFSNARDSYSIKSAEVNSNDSFLDRINGNSKSIGCVLALSDRNEADSILIQIKNELSEHDCIQNICGNFVRDNPEYKLLFNKEGFASTSLTPFEIGRNLCNSVQGAIAASLDTGREKDTDILVRYKKNYTDSAEKISSLRIPLKEGVFDPSSFTEIDFNKNYRSLTRLNRKNCFYLNIVPSKGMKDKALAILLKYRDRGLKIPSVKKMEKTRRETIFLFISALVLLYFFLGAQFESFLIPLFLMFSIPLSLSGSLTLLYISRGSLNISSFLGILILAGTTVNTAIMIFAGRGDIQYSIKASAERRLVPAAAAILTTAAALIPAAVQIKNPIQASSATALIGGLVSGGTAVLLIYPFLFDREKKGAGQHTAERKGPGRDSYCSHSSEKNILYKKNQNRNNPGRDK